MKSSKKQKPKSAAPAHKKRASHKKTGRRRVPTCIGKIAAVTRELNLSERRIYQLLHEGLPQVKPGRYELRECFRWYVRFMQQKLIDRAHPERNEDDAAAIGGVIRHKMLSIQSELKEIELAERREGLISRDRAEKDTAKIIAEIRRRILALSPKIAADVVGESDLAVSQVKIDRSLKGALEALSEFDPDDPSSRSRTQ